MMQCLYPSKYLVKPTPTHPPDCFAGDGETTGTACLQQLEAKLSEIIVCIGGREGGEVW